LRNGQEHFFKEISTSPIMVASYKAKLEVVFVGSSELETSGCAVIRELARISLLWGL